MLDEKTLDARLAEIQAIGGERQHHLKMQFTAEQDKCLVAAWESKMTKQQIVAWWRAQGWEAHENTLRRRYNELTDG